MIDVCVGAAPSTGRLIFDSTVLELLPAAICFCGPDGRLPGYNRRAAELWSREPKLNASIERYCGSHKLFLPDGSDLPQADCPMAEALRSGKSFHGLEVVVEQPSGRRISAFVNVAPLRGERGEIVGALNCFQDVTELKGAQALLQEREQHFRELLDALPAAIYTADAEGRITFYNAAAVSFWGHRPPLGTSFWCGSWRLHWPDGRPMPHRARRPRGCRPPRRHPCAVHRLSSVKPGPQPALLLDMVLPELATNAAKYGALSAPAGRLVLSWSAAEAHGRRRLAVDWRETGGPAVEPPQARGFGLRRIERGIAQELRGSTRIVFDPGGVQCRLGMPLPARPPA